MVFMIYSLCGYNNTSNAFTTKIKEIVSCIRIQSLLAEKEKSAPTHSLRWTKHIKESPSKASEHRSHLFYRCQKFYITAHSFISVVYSHQEKRTIV